MRRFFRVRYLKAVTLILAVAACAVSCPKEGPEGETRETGFVFAPYPNIIACETFDKFPPGRLSSSFEFEWDAMAENTRTGIFWLSLYPIAGAGRADIVREGGRSALRLWRTGGMSTNGITPQSYLFFIPHEEIAPAVRNQRRNLLLQYQIRLENAANVSAHTTVYHSNEQEPDMGPCSVDTLVNGRGKFRVHTNDYEWAEFPAGQNAWHSVEILIDYRTRTYKVYLDGRFLTMNYEYQQSNTLGFGKVGWYCDSPNMAMYITNITISTNAAFEVLKL